MKLTKLFVLLPVIGVLGACQFKDDPIEFDYTSTYFVNQEYIRNVVVGEGLSFKPGVVLAGVIENKSSRSAEYTIDASLVPTGKVLLPTDYYTMSNSSAIPIPSGHMKGYVTVSLDSTKFVNDPRSLTGEFVLPLRLTGTKGIDRITEEKDVMVISMSYFAKQQANYNYSGTADKIKDGVTTPVSYANNPSLNNSIRLLRTVGPDLMRVVSDKTANGDPVLGTTSFYIQVPVHGGGAVTVSADPACPVVVSPHGESTYDEAKRTFTLGYKFTMSDGTEYRVKDVLVFRNRIRDMQSNGIDYINEW